MSDHLLHDPGPMEPILSSAELVRTAAQLIAAIAVALIAAAHIRPLLATHAPAAQVANPAFTCPVPTKPGQVTTITWSNNAGVITHRCQVIQDWPLLNPKGANKP